MEKVQGSVNEKVVVLRPRRHCTLTPPTPSTTGNVSVSVGSSRLLVGVCELGLFAAAAVRKNTIVCSFRYISLTARQSRKWLRTHGLEEYPDSGFPDLDRVLHDPSFKSVQDIPCWYRLNHSYYPNLRLVSWQHGLVEWMAIDDIAQWDELTFLYGRPDPSWRPDQ